MLPFSLHFVAFYQDGGADGYLSDFPFCETAGVARLEFRLHFEGSVGIAVYNGHGYVVFLFAFQHDGFFRRNVNLGFFAGIIQAIIDGLVEDIKELSTIYMMNLLSSAECHSQYSRAWS